MEISHIQSEIAATKHNRDLYDETNFSGRVQAVDFLDFILNDTAHRSLHHSTRLLKQELENIDAGVFKKIRSSIITGNYTHEELHALPQTYFSNGSGLGLDEPGYDDLDLFINGILDVEEIPDETIAREPEMVFFQKTPARIIFKMIELAPIRNDDIFYDIGSGLGQVPILVNLLSGARAKGVEVEPAYCDYARKCAAILKLSHVEIIQSDARTADFSDGTVFFMYTPFKGKILEDILKRLHEISREKTITLCTYGPCSEFVSRQSWLHSPAGENSVSPNKLYVFKSM